MCYATPRRAQGRCGETRVMRRSDAGCHPHRRPSPWLLLPFVLVVCCSRTPERPPDLYVLLVDTLRADHLSAYGYTRPTSPALEQLAKDGLVFTNVTAPSSWTLPSVGSLFTARYPAVHGLRAYGAQAPETVRCLRSGVVTLAATLQQRG